MRRLNDDNQDSPDEMTELLNSQDDQGPEVYRWLFIMKTNAFRFVFLLLTFRDQMLLFYPM